MSELIKEYEILKLKNKNFRIPLYQREYAWSEDEVIQLLEDLKTFHNKNNKNSYFLGNIVVSRNNEVLDVIDGQQRLTTLYLILKILKKDVFNLDYEIREEDRKFLKTWDGEKKENLNSSFANNILAIFNWKKENEEIFEKILENVVVTITEIPKEVDVVKYFEVMNNRGKQLEKHQILKAKFLKKLKDNNKFNWAKIWDYCSKMNSTIEDLIYYNDLKERKDGSVDKLRKDLLQSFNHEELKKESNNNKKTILNIIEKDMEEEEKELQGKEYRSIIKFEIFLIQVLKLFIAKEKLENKGFKNLDEITINDSYLLGYFYKDKTHNKFLFDEKLAKEFLEFLLKMRILFDYFILKRDGEDKPIIKGIDNKDLLMIELLFVNSAPQYFSQDWIIVLLAYLDKNINSIVTIENEKMKIDYKKVIKFLENFDKELAEVRLSEERIVDYINKKIKNILNNENIDKIEITKNLKTILNQGTSTPHYWFYKLDYLLWRDYNWKQDFAAKFNNLDYSTIKNDYRLTRLHSIEHIYPQSKKGDWNCEKCANECLENCIDCFGNLALISNHMNSSLIDEDFNVKRTIIQKQLAKGTIESLKMLLVYSKYKEWTPENCEEHQKEMIDKLIENLK